MKRDLDINTIYKTDFANHFVAGIFYLNLEIPRSNIGQTQSDSREETTVLERTGLKSAHIILRRHIRICKDSYAHGCKNFLYLHFNYRREEPFRFILVNSVEATRTGRSNENKISSQFE
jgi:hypothetical protein